MQAMVIGVQPGDGMFFDGDAQQTHAKQRGHHRRVPSDPFEFDEPFGAAVDPLFSTLKCPATGGYGNAFQNFEETMSGSDSDDSNASMVEDIEFPLTTVDSRVGGGFWGDVDPWMLGVGTSDAQTDGSHGGPWLGSAESGPLELVPVGRSSSYDSTVSAGVTPSALPVMSPFSNAGELPSPLSPSPAPAPADGAATSSDATLVGEKRPRFSAGAYSPHHRVLKANRHSAMVSGSGQPSVPVSTGADCEPPPLLQKPLPAEVAARMLRDDSYDPGMRPVIFNAADGQWLFKERCRGRVPALRAVNERSNERADRWHNSGGVRGARDMPKNGTPLVRRRYGSVAQNGEILWRFHEYSALTVVEDPAAPEGRRIEEDRSTVVFHVMPKRSGKGRPSKAEAELPAQMWKEYGWST